MRALILGGTGDANKLADRFARANVDALYSYAGRTQIPLGHALPTRIGGFGGASGLAAFIRQERITHVIDATHPFAAEMSRNAVDACTQGHGVSDPKCRRRVHQDDVGTFAKAGEHLAERLRTDEIARIRRDRA